MRISFVSGVRNDLLQEVVDRLEEIRDHEYQPPDDRNVTSPNMVYRTTNTNHAVTSRLTYTVPTDRWAIIRSIKAVLERTNAMTGVNHSDIYLNYTPSGGSAQTIFEVNCLNSTPNVRHRDAVDPNFFLREGDELELFTSNSSTTGSIRQEMFVLIQEFDVA